MTSVTEAALASADAPALAATTATLGLAAAGRPTLGLVAGKYVEVREGLREGDAPGDIVRKPALYGMQIVADLLGGYEHHKTPVPPAPEQSKIVAHTGLGDRTALIDNPDAARQREEASVLGNLPSPSTPNVAQSRSAHVGPESAGRSLV